MENQYVEILNIILNGLPVIIFYLDIFGCCIVAAHGLVLDSRDRLVLHRYMFVYKFAIRLRKFYCILDIPNLPILRMGAFRISQSEFLYHHHHSYVLSDALRYRK